MSCGVTCLNIPPLFLLYNWSAAVEHTAGVQYTCSMLCCGGESLALAVEEDAQHRNKHQKLLPQVPELACELEGVLQNEFSAEFLQLFAESEYSSNSLIFLRKLTELRRQLQERSKRSSYKVAASNLIEAMSDPKMVARAEEIIKEHVCLNNDVCLATHLRALLLDWIRSDENVKKAGVPMVLLSTTYRDVLQSVKYDIFPRFKNSAYYDELRLLHIKRSLHLHGMRKALEEWLDEEQRPALHFLLSVANVGSSPSSTTVQVILEKHRAVLQKAGLEVDTLEGWTQSEHSIREVLDAAQEAVFGSIAEAYVQFLRMDQHATGLVRELGVAGPSLIATRKPTKVSDEKPTGASVDLDLNDLLDSDLDYAAGW